MPNIKTRFLIFCFSAVCLLYLVCATDARCFNIIKNYLESSDHDRVTDEQLKQLAIVKGLVPYEIDSKFIEREIEEKHTITVWFVITRKDKIRLLDYLKVLYGNDGVKIRRSSAYYVDEINKVLYNSMMNEEIDAGMKIGLGIFIKSIAIMDGDFDNGKNKEQVFRDWAGEEFLEFYKIAYPDKYQALLEKDQY